jgi:hypothetical protein
MFYHHRAMKTSPRGWVSRRQPAILRMWHFTDRRFACEETAEMVTADCGLVRLKFYRWGGPVRSA